MAIRGVYFLLVPCFFAAFGLTSAQAFDAIRHQALGACNSGVGSFAESLNDENLEKEKDSENFELLERIAKLYRTDIRSRKEICSCVVESFLNVMPSDILDALDDYARGVISAQELQQIYNEPRYADSTKSLSAVEQASINCIKNKL